MEDLEFWQDDGGLLLAAFFGAIAILTFGVGASLLEIRGSIMAIQFDGIGAYYHLFGIFPVEITRETQAGIADSFYEVAAAILLFSLVSTGLTVQQLFQWRGSRKVAPVGDPFLN